MTIFVSQRALTGEAESGRNRKQEKEDGVFSPPQETTYVPDVDLDQILSRMLTDNPDLNLSDSDMTPISILTLNKIIGVIIKGQSKMSKATRRREMVKEVAAKQLKASIVGKDVMHTPGETPILKLHPQTTVGPATDEQPLVNATTIQTRYSRQFENPTPIFGLDAPVSLSFTIQTDSSSHHSDSSTISSFEPSTEMITQKKDLMHRLNDDLNEHSVLEIVSDQRVITNLQSLHLSSKEELLAFLESGGQDGQRELIMMTLHA